MFLSIPNYVMKNGPSHGARHGNTERQKIFLRSSQRKKESKEKWSQNHIGQIPEQAALRKS